jgi:uncharacterized protein (DUF1786 family)
MQFDLKDDDGKMVDDGRQMGGGVQVRDIRRLLWRGDAS